MTGSTLHGLSISSKSLHHISGTETEIDKISRSSSSDPLNLHEAHSDLGLELLVLGYLGDGARGGWGLDRGRILM